jgi:very-short-patch-repair endonuclease
VLADASTTEPHLVVELDDRIHWRADAKESDAFKNAALGAAGVPILRVVAAGRYEEAEIRSKVRAALSASPG